MVKLKVSKILSVSSTTITIICLAFLMYQTVQCIYKFYDGIKGTDVRIAEAAKQVYPAVTICPLPHYSENPVYAKNLGRCNLSPKEYFDEAKWVGTGGPGYCKDPAELYEKVVGNGSSFIKKIDVGSSEQASEDGFMYLDHPFYKGRCFSVPLPKNAEITGMTIEGVDEIDVTFHTPGNYYDPDYKYVHIHPQWSKNLDLNNEIFHVLDYDGQECKNYLDSTTRDACIVDFITLQSMESLGCTTPYLTDKSNICTDQEKARKATELYVNLKDDLFNDRIEVCPKPCENLMIDFGRLSETETDTPESELHIHLRKFIKVSTVSYTYKGLELFAEVGGYMGLLLGISLSQLPGLIADMVQKFQFSFNAEIVIRPENEKCDCQKNPEKQQDIPSLTIVDETPENVKRKRAMIPTRKAVTESSRT